MLVTMIYNYFIFLLKFVSLINDFVVFVIYSSFYNFILLIDLFFYLAVIKCIVIYFLFIWFLIYFIFYFVHLVEHIFWIITYLHPIFNINLSNILIFDLFFRQFFLFKTLRHIHTTFRLFNNNFIRIIQNFSLIKLNLIFTWTLILTHTRFWSNPYRIS